MFQVRDLRSRAIARENDLLMAVEERVERVEEFFLRPFLAAEELNVINQQEISLAITLPELHQVVVLNRVDEVVDEQLAREVHHLAAFFLAADILPDRLHEVRLAEPDTAVNKEWVIRPRRRL